MPTNWAARLKRRLIMVKEQIIREIESLPTEFYSEILGFVGYLKYRRLSSSAPETMLLSEKSLAESWDTPEEDEAVKGDIVVINFPFSDMSGIKRRPALVVSEMDNNDVILCQITSRVKSDKYAVRLEADDFTVGCLSVESVVRTNKLFTADVNTVLYTACKIGYNKLTEIINTICRNMDNSDSDNKDNTPKGNIIILNGVSSTGKTTLAKVLQERLPSPYFHMDVDVFCLMAPEKYARKDYSLQHSFVVNMFDAVKAFADKGFNIIVPCVFLKGYGFMEKCMEALFSYSVLLVHVTCPIDELRRREMARGDRRVGSAEEMLPVFIPKGIYDVEVDTYKNTLDECADIIIEMQSKHITFTAMQRINSFN
jgi:chloramphenicol 3-O-phosphotransferase/mRNA-degrading endonuclease toxin of MazEF toxin-antitoxin module